MKRYTYLIAALAVGTFLTTAAFAQTPPSAAPTPLNGGADVIKAALDACAKSVAKDAKGNPNSAALEACMKKKGFDDKAPGGNAPPPPPPPPPAGAPPQH